MRKLILKNIYLKYSSGLKFLNGLDNEKHNWHGPLKKASTVVSLLSI